MTISYDPKEYLELFKLVEKRYIKDCFKYNKKIANEKNETAWYGYNAHSPRETLKRFEALKSASITLMINKDEKVLAYLRNRKASHQNIFNGGRTLQRYKRTAEQGGKVDVKDNIDNILKLYVQENAIETEVPRNFLLTLSNKYDYHYYLGTYYSIKDYGVKTFLLLFSKDKDEKGSYRTYEIGFHNVRGGDKGKENVLYLGNAYYEDSYIYANLTRENSKHQLNIICNTFTNEQTSMNTSITCSIQGVSLYGGIVSAECYLIKLKKNFLRNFLEKDIFEIPKVENILNVIDSITLSLYLWLHKSTFLVSHRKNYEISKLEARGVRVKTFKDLKGTYRIWQYGLKEFTIVQSRFTINGDGTGWLCPPVELSRNKKTPMEIMKKLQKQPCSLNLSYNTQRSPVAIIETHFEKLNIFNTAMFSCVPAKRGDVTIGAFSTIGYYEERSIPSSKKRKSKSFSDVVTGYFVMQKDESPFNPEVLSFEKAEKIAADFNFKLLLKKLINVWLSKSWDLSPTEKRKIIEVERRLA